MNSQTNEKINDKKTRRTKNFPGTSFEDSLIIAETLFNISGGLGKARRLTLFEHLQKSPESGPSRQLVTNSSKYGLTTGGYSAEYLELTDNGKIAVNPEQSSRERLRAQYKLAIEGIEPFKILFETYSGQKLPTPAVMQDTLVEKGLPKEDTSECIDLFIANSQFIGLIKTLSGTERLLTLDHALDEKDSSPSEVRKVKNIESNNQTSKVNNSIDRDWNNICFYITPIGEENSEFRKHSDLILGSFVEPAMQNLGLQVIRADKIGEPGMITSQILEHIKKSKLVIADLSYLNPNVFYEIGLRHCLRLPVVQIIRKSDRLPFDIGQVRTVVLDTTDIFSLVPKIQVYISEIATQSRAAIDDPELIGNPISIFYPKFFD